MNKEKLLSILCSVQLTVVLCVLIYLSLSYKGVL